MCKGNSTTWSNHVQLICQKYGFPSPLFLMLSGPSCSKSSWNTQIKTRITVWHEEDLRRKAARNSKMKYLNVALCGLSGRPHPALQNIYTTQEAKKLRLHLKFLTGDFLTNERLSLDNPSVSPACTLCQAPTDSIEHVLVVCRATSEVRKRLLPELLNTVARVQPMSQILLNNHPASILTQFVLDCTSINLPETIRVPAHNPGTSDIFSVSRAWCFAVSNQRSRLLRNLSATEYKDD